MALLDRFRAKPPWQHSDPLVRAAAVREMGPEEQNVLAELASGDADPRVRRAAVRRLADPALLAERAREDADEGVREEATGLLLDIALAADEAKGEIAVLALTEPRHLVTVARTAKSERLRQSALARLAAPKALVEVARDAEDPAIRLAALTRIGERGFLAELALKCEHKDVAMAALERIQDRDMLEAVGSRARSKAAARQARVRLEVMGPVPVTPAERRREICERLESRAVSGNWAQVAEDLAAARGTWDALGAEAEAEWLPRFNAGVAALEARLTGHREAVAEGERRAEARAGEWAAALALCETIESAGGADATAQLEAARVAWAQLPPAADAEGEALARRFEDAGRACLARQEAFLAAEARRSQGEALCVALLEAAAPTAPESGVHLAAARKEWAAYEAEGPVASELLARVERALADRRERETKLLQEQAQREKGNRARLTTLCERMEALAREKDPSFREAERRLREARTALAEGGFPPLPSRQDREALMARLKAAKAALYPRVQELRETEEWRRWANLGVEEQLCQRVEALRSRSDFEAVDHELRELEAEWRGASDAPKAQAEPLWQRFKTTRDEVRARCQAFFAQQAAERAENLKRKEALCVQAEALGDSQDWLKTAEELKRFQAEWKTIGPAARGGERAVWERFRKACDRFFTRRKEDLDRRKDEWAKNLVRKEELCARVEALADSTDWDAAAAEIRRLQGEWKTIGSVRRNRSEAVWQRFRTAGDRFFERYKRRDSLELEARRGEAEALCRELEALCPEDAETPPAPDDLAGRVEAAQASLRRSGVAGADPLAERLQQAVQRLLQKYPERFRGTDLDSEANRKKKERLCAKVEALLPSEEVAASTADLATRLREALATNTMGGKANAAAFWESRRPEVEGSQEAWKRIGPVPGEVGRALSDRFDTACRRFFEARPRTPPEAKIPRRPPASSSRGRSA